MRFREYCRRNALFAEHDTVIAAVSGGVDSMVLLDLLARERGLNVIVGHFNHRLRGVESDGDEEFVARRAEKYGFPFNAGRGDTAAESKRRKVGIQEAARDMRYDFLKKLRESAGGGHIATAHQADDNAETILLHLFRGTGVQGMAGIPVSRDGVIRPLLFAGRAEIEEFAHNEQLPFRTDSSNAKDRYARNVLRHRVLPLLKDVVSPSVVENINRSGENFRALAAYIMEEAGKALEACTTGRGASGIRLSVERLEARPLFLRQLAVRSAVEETSGSAAGTGNVDAVLALLENEPGTRVTLAGGTVAERTRDELVIGPPAEERAFDYAVEVGRSYALRGFRFAATMVEARGPVAGRGVEYADAAATGPGPLTLRNWREGDSFVPLGMGGRKKVSDFFVDEKVPASGKKEIPLLVTPGGEIVWVCGMRLDDRFKITPATRRVIKLEFSTTSPT
ncbi:MAG TPA: tRNA lysidine(34) synthetase TilS [Bacteroidota bacterium]|nr:tRNA lysidine(34) synthetase TilS [Bacteroidota bacterium]